MTITGGFLRHNETTTVEPWEVRVWANDPTKHIEIVDEPKTKKKKK